MKRLLIATTLSFSVALTYAQKESEALPKGPTPDSTWSVFPKLYQQPFGEAFPKEYNRPFNNKGKKNSGFETSNPGAVFLYKTPKGSVYKMPLDNMAVLVPEMSMVEKMPGRRLSDAEQTDKMPNPYHNPRGSPKNK